MSTSSAPGSPVFEMTSSSTSTTASSPPPDSSNFDETKVPFIEDMSINERYARLSFLLEKSAVYSSLLKERIDKAKHAAAATSMKTPMPETMEASGGHNSKKRCRVETGDSDDQEEAVAKRIKLSNAEQEDDDLKFQQPALVTGATLKDYQLEGVAWMIGLFDNGISGILADEMGLGKTIQTIAFSAYLRERISGPFLVVCPLSVLHNWMEEYKKFAPDIPVCMYHGTPAERAELRRTVLWPPPSDSDENGSKKEQENIPVREETKARKGKARSNTKGKAKSAKRNAKPPKAETKTSGTRKGLRRSGRFKGTYDEEDEDVKMDEEDEEAAEERGRVESGSRDEDEAPVLGEDGLEDAQKEEKDAAAEVKTDTEGSAEPVKSNFPVVVTTYEMLIRDRQYLSQYNWGFIVVDEGHRLKNFDCRLMKEIKKYPSAGRLVLTGTPLQNNLAELWSLLNFILPDLFNDLDSFQEWFNLSAMHSSISAAKTAEIMGGLHAILKPFLLRRLKADVDIGLPPKKEYVLYAPLSGRQRELYDAIIQGGLRQMLLNEKQKGNPLTGGVEVDVKAPRKLRSKRGEVKGKGLKRKGKRKGKDRHYDVDGDDDEYFEKLESGELEAESRRETERSAEEVGREWQHKSAMRQVNNMRLQNMIMQLRKVCSHPFLFEWPLDPRSHQPVVNEELVNASGKMMLLERLLDELFKTKHKVLIFSQFTTMLDIIEAWALEFKGWPLCRIDGSTSPDERRDQMNRFQQGGDAPDAPILFLLSTRAGGLGVNLTAADTVIFYDQDWNPQMDIQAQDRAHRIGQTKPVLIFRLVTDHTIETKIMQRASEKRQLEALVIAKGKYKNPAVASNRNAKTATLSELATNLLKIEGSHIDVVQPSSSSSSSSPQSTVISDEELNMLLDRSEQVFTERGTGWDSKKGMEKNEKESNGREGEKEGGRGEERAAKFAVFSGAAAAGNEMLAGLMGENAE